MYVMNATIDDLSEFRKSVKRALKAKLGRKKLPKGFIEKVPGEGVLLDLPNAPYELVFDGGGLFNGKLYHLLAAEFHYRNDATRHHWGQGLPLEVTLPSQSQQAVEFASCLTAFLQCGEVPGVLLFPEMHADEREHGDSTDDRHRLVVAFEYPLFDEQDMAPIAAAMLNFKPYRCDRCGTRGEEEQRDINERCDRVVGGSVCGGKVEESPFSLMEVVHVERRKESADATA
jgi:hypothetical protein